MKNSLIVIIILSLSIFYACKEPDCLSPYNDCNCAEGYEGQDCATRSTTRFLGQYTPEFRPDTATYRLTIVDSVDSGKKVYFKNFNYSFFVGSTSFIPRGDFYGIVDGEHIKIPEQFPTGRPNFRSLSGEACLNKNTEGVTELIFDIQFEGSKEPAKMTFRKRR